MDKRIRHTRADRTARATPGAPVRHAPSPTAAPKVFISYAGDDRDLVKLALNGKLSRSARQAVREQTAQGLSITYKRGEQIVRRAADGTIEVLGSVATPRFQLPDHVRKIGR